MNQRSIKITVNIIIIAIGIWLYWFMLHLSNQSIVDLLKKSMNVNLYFPIIVILSTFIIHILLANRWRLLIGCFEDAKSIPKGFVFYNINIAILMASVLPVIAYTGTKALSLKVDLNLSPTKTVYAGIIESIVGMTATIFMMIPGLLYMLGIIKLCFAVYLYILIMILFFLFFYNYYLIILNILACLYKYLVSKANAIKLFKGKFNENKFDPSIFIMIDRKTSFLLVCYTILIQYGAMFKYYIIIIAFNVNIDFLTFAIIFPTVYLISSIGLTPGSFGISEFTWFYVLTLVNVNNNNAAVYSVANRIFHEFSIIIITIFSYIYFLIQRYRVHKIKLL